MSIIVLLLYICDLDLVKLHVAFLFYLLPFMVNEDEYRNLYAFYRMALFSVTLSDP